MKREFILSTFGLGRLEPKIIIGHPLQQNDSGFNQIDGPDDYNMSTAPDDKTLYSKQLLGVPIWADIILKEDKQNGLELQILEVLLTISQKKKIIETGLQGRDGEVNEYISKSNYQIKIVGAFCDKNPNRYPVEDVNNLIKLLDLPEALVLTSKFAQLFGIHNIIIKDYDFAQRAGYQNLQAFNINATSDEPIQLQERKE